MRTLFFANMSPSTFFVCADTDAKVRRCVERAPEDEKLTEKELIRKMKQIDRTRAQTREIVGGYDAALLDMTARAFTICATPFLVMWFNMYTSCFFTALNDGAVSAAISFMRALLLPVICIIVMPMLFQLDGVWYSLVGSEILGVFVSLYFLLGKREKYQY